jgi:hypothetical protein
MPARPLALRRGRRDRPRAHHRVPRVPHCLLRRAGKLRCGHPRGADGGQGPGFGTSVGRHYHLRRSPVAWSGGYLTGRIPLHPFQRRGQTQGGRRPPAFMAALRAHHLRMPTRMGVSGKRRQSYQPRISRGPRRAGKAGLQGYGRTVYGGRSWRAAQTPAAVCSGPRQMWRGAATLRRS